MSSSSFYYKFSTSSSASSCDISHCSLSCNFDNLAAAYPEFRRELEEVKKRRHPISSNVVEKQRLSSQVNHAFNAALTRALLHYHFGLNMPSLPEGRLCPPVPNRCNYVAWLKQLLLSNSTDLYRFCNTGSDLLQYRGIDIGTGVSAIYPLLLTTKLFAKSDELKCETHKSATTFTWKFLATDIDPVAIESACNNIGANNLQDDICVALVDENSSGPLFAAMEASKKEPMFFQQREQAETIHDEYPKFDFVMTNPPFYATVEEVTTPRAGDKRSRTDISMNEGLYKSADDCSEGGDVGFIESIIHDSLHFQRHVTWYTSLIAKRSSLNAIYQKLQTVEGIYGNRGQIRTVEFRQENIAGERKKKQSSPRVRWGIAWTYERAMGRCSSCRVRGGLQSFNVSISMEADKKKQAVDEVSSRLVVYFSEMKFVSLKCIDEPRERSFDGIVDGRCKERCITVIEERFSAFDKAPSQEHEKDNRNLPHEGHFVLDVFIGAKKEKQSNEGQIDVNVCLEAYAHTSHGTLLLDKILGPLPGEIGRTNRRWRRLLKRQLTS